LNAAADPSPPPEPRDRQGCRRQRQCPERQHEVPPPHPVGRDAHAPEAAAALDPAVVRVAVTVRRRLPLEEADHAAPLRPHPVAAPGLDGREELELRAKAGSRFGYGRNRGNPFAPLRGGLAEAHGGNQATLMHDRLSDGDPLVGERNLLAALVRRPALIAHLAEELAHLLLQNRRHEALRAAMLGWANGTVAGSLGVDSVDGMAASGQNHDEAIEKGAFLAHLADLALLSVAQDVLSNTADSTGEQPSLANQAAQWRYAAALHNAEIGREAMLAEAEKAWAESPTEENWRRLQALIDQVSPGPPVG